MQTPRVRLALPLLCLLAACSDDSKPPAAVPGDDLGHATMDADVPSDARKIPVRGAVNGLRGAGLRLRLGNDELAITQDGEIAFPTPLKPGDAWDVRVVQQPSMPTQTCVVAGGKGTDARPSKGSIFVLVSCTTDQFSLGGTVSGLRGSGLEIKNGPTGEPLAISADGHFVFPKKVESGQAFSVLVQTEPSDPSQSCDVAGGTGTMLGADVGTVTIECGVRRYPIGGTVTGLEGTGLVLKNGDSEEIAVTANGEFALARTVASGDAYDVTIKTQPHMPWQTCVLQHGSGVVADHAIADLAITCTKNTYHHGGNVAGLLGAGLVLKSGAQVLPVTADGSFTFPAAVSSGTAYHVVVDAQPTAPKQTCVVSNGDGAIGGADANGITVQCTTDRFKLSGAVSGLVGAGLTLANGDEEIAIAHDGAFELPSTILSGVAYDVQVKAQPHAPWQTCAVTAGAGTITDHAVTDVAVACTTNAYHLSAAVSGLRGAGLVLHNGADDVPVGIDGTVSFPTAITSGQAFAVSVKAQPSSPTQSCVVTGGSGTIGGGDVASVVVSCDTERFAVGGSVTGLGGNGLVLANGADTVHIAGNGAFAFPSLVESGEAYAAAVTVQPTSPWQTCAIVHAAGIVGASAVSDIQVTCTTNHYPVGGTVAGLSGSGFALLVNGTTPLPITADGAFVLPSEIDSGAGYALTIAAQPTSPWQTCQIANPAGVVQGAGVNDIAITCTKDSHTIAGTVVGLLGSGLVLTNAGTDLPVGADGAFLLPAMASGDHYAVTVKTQPQAPWQTCTVALGAGDVADHDVTDVAVTCTTNTYNVGGSITGLVGSGLVLTNNGGDDLAVAAASTSFQLATKVASDQPYALAVKTQPSSPSQTCVVAAPSGTVAGADVVAPSITCTTNKYFVRGAVNGLVGAGLVLTDNGGDDLPIAADGAFVFASKVSSGAPYLVAVKTQPSGPTQACTVSAGSGTVGGGDVTAVAVNCTTSSYSVGGTVSGLAGTGLVLTNNGGNDLPISGNSSFAFSLPVASGATYAVAVKTSPSSPQQTCTVTNGAGTVVSSAISNVSVVCTTTKYAVGGTVTGLHGGTVVLRNNGGDDLSLSGNASFSFATKIANGSTYAVTVLTNPAGQACTVSNGSGTVGTANVTNVTVSCVDLTCQNLGWKTGSASWACPSGFRMPTASELSKVQPCVTPSDTAFMSYYHGIAYSVGGCNCKWNGSWCGQPSIETFDQGRTCGDYTQLHICVAN